MNDSKIINAIHSGNSEKVFVLLYHYFPRVKKYMVRSGVNTSDVEDIFQESLIVLHHKLTTKDFVLTTSIYNYLLAIVKNKCLSLFRNKKYIAEDITTSISSDIEEFAPLENQYKKAERAFAKLGNRCKELLIAYYHHKLSFKEIAKTLQFTSDKIAKNQKYKCLHKARKYYKDFITLSIHSES